MSTTKIETYQYLINNPLVHVRIDDKYRTYILNIIIEKYGSLRNYNAKYLHILDQTISLQFRRNTFFKFERLMKIAKKFRDT